MEGPPLPRRGSGPLDWEWSLTERSRAQRPDFVDQTPEPSVAPPDGYTFPQSPIYTINKDYDPRCSRGYYLSAPFDTTKVTEYKKHFNCLISPPNVSPYAFDRQTQTWLRHPIPGVSKIKPGWQYIHNIDGDTSKAVSVAMLHTANSLIEGYDDGYNIRDLCNKLCDIAFGCPAQGDVPARKPLYEFEGLKPNDRSGPRVPGSWDGSYNLASTLIKGKGRGVCAPAITAAYKDAVNAISEACVLLHTIFRGVIKKSLFREEFEAIEFHSIDNNVFGFGGLEPNNTGLQMNVSSDSAGRSLTNAIGEKQGAWHVDQGDDPCGWTVLVLCFNLSPGKLSTNDC